MSSSGPEPFSEFEIATVSITEEGITSIWIQDEDEGCWNSFEPNDQRVKWFRDQLGQNWLKFYYTSEVGEVTCFVYPADMCRCVEYAKS